MDGSMDVDGSSYLQYSPHITYAQEPSSSATKRGFREFHQDNIKENTRAYREHQNASSRILIANRKISPPKGLRASKSVRIISPRAGDFYSPKPDIPSPAPAPESTSTPASSPPRPLLPAAGPRYGYVEPFWETGNPRPYRATTYWMQLSQKRANGTATDKDFEELYKIKGWHYHEPLRRSVSRTVTFVQSTAASIWGYIAGFFSSGNSVQEEIISVAIDATNKKRRAVSASRPSSANNFTATTFSPPQPTSHIPGDFPDTEMSDAPVERVSHVASADTPKEQLPKAPLQIASPTRSNHTHASTDSNTDTETTNASPVQVLSTPPHSRPASADGLPQPQKRNSPQPTKHDSPMAPERRYKGYDRNIKIPLNYTPSMVRLDYSTLAQEAERQEAEMQAQEVVAPVPSHTQGRPAEPLKSLPSISRLPGRKRTPEEEARLKWYRESQSVRSRVPVQRWRTRESIPASVLRNAQKDVLVDELVKRAKDIVLSPSINKELSRSQQEQKARAAAEEIEEAQKQKLADEGKEELVTPQTGVTAEQSESLPTAELSDEYKEKQKIIRPLPAEWATRVDQAMATKNRHQTLATTVDGTSLSRHDFGHILPQAGTGDEVSGWLNDEIVNAWMSAIVEEKNNEKDFAKAGNRVPLFVAYASAWYTTFKNKGIEGISRWSRRKGIQGAKLLDCKKVFFPINTGAHWSLLIISPNTRGIEFLNSMNSSSTKRHFMRIAREWLQMELKEKYIEDEWTEMSTQSESQTNNNDCGLFVCYNGLISAKGTENFADLALPGFEMTPNGRRLMAAILINGGFHGDWKL